MNIDVTKMERKEPIGAEQDDDTNSVLSLEQILQSPNKSFSTKEIIKIYFFSSKGPGQLDLYRSWYGISFQGGLILIG